MAEKMKNKQAIEVLKNFKTVIKINDEFFEALDIALECLILFDDYQEHINKLEEHEEELLEKIESLDNEWQTDAPKESGFYLVTNGANKLDIRKWDNGWYHDMYRRYTNEELKVVAWKKVEPYERKE